MSNTALLEQVVSEARRLSTLDKLRLIERVTPEIERDLLEAGSARRPGRSLWGLVAELGSAPSEEEIAAMRRDAWPEFPRSGT